MAPWHLVGVQILLHFLLLPFLLFTTSEALAMPAINLSNPYSQEFNLLANSGTSNSWIDDSTIGGWYANRLTYAAGTGSSNTGALYSFGSVSASDRALGGVASGTTGTIFWGVRFVNNTANTISSLDISYVGEQWRNGGSTTTPSVAQKLDFQYQIGASNLTTGTWIDFDPLDFTSPIFGTTSASALDGNAPANRTNLSASLSGLSIAPGQEIWLRWQDINDANNDHGLAIDDFSIAADFANPAGITIAQSGGSTDANEQGETSDTYTIALNTVPTGTVNMAIASDAQTLLSTDGVNFFTSINLSFTDTTAQTITVKAVNDTAIESSPHTGVITHTIINSADPAYANISIPNLSVNITDNDIAPAIRISDIQGTAHRSPLEGQTVSNVEGIVTALRSNGFYLQDPNPDNNDATSEGIFVFTSSAPTVSIGDSIRVNGRVSEFRPGGTGGTNNLSITQITNPTVNVLSNGNPLPAVTIIGIDNRPIPNQIIDNDAVGGTVENAATLFDPAQDGIDFYESLEGMLVGVNNAVVVGPTNNFGEIPVLADNGANATGRTARGGIRVQPGDFNPERIIIDDALVSNPPQVNVGDTFNNLITGVIDYSFGNFKLLNTAPLPTVTSGGLTPETTALIATPDQLTVATFNVENLDPGDGSVKFNSIASAIVNNLKSPDVISLEEIQDNNGATNDSVVDASVTYQTLINAIASAGGPTYEFRQIDPVDDQDGGEPGGNIRVGFLFNPNRVSFVDRPSGTSTSNTTVNNVGGDPQLSASPGRIDPTNSAFNASRKPLVGEFLFNGNRVFVIGNHFNSKGGDQPLFGRFQPPTLTTEAQRNQQATIVKDFVQSILAVDPNANVIVAGDLNDFEFSNPLNILKSGGLNSLIETLPANERYTYNFEGNSQTLDHILSSNNLLNRLDGFDVVHINSEFADQVSDHDPSVARFNLPTLINGTPNADTLVGTNRNEVINGQGGNDYISGQGGNDAINGGAGNNDRMFGGAGNDTIADPDGILGAHGGTGNDTINVTFAPTWDNNTNPNDAPRSDGKITGGYGNDDITVTMNHPRFFINLKGDEPVNPISNDPRDGNDVITLLGSYANSVVDLGGGNDRFNGGNGSDNVSGSGGDDIINGGAGGDRISGDAGNDTLIGGAGSDRFVLAPGAGTDLIADFTDNEDRIGLSAGLSFAQISVTQGTGVNASDTLIKLIANNELLAILSGVNSSNITLADFVSV
jgi:predicted extracellular nuclease